MGYRKPSAEWARELLRHVSADCDRASWFEIACALHSGLGASDGWPVFRDWSQTAAALFDDAAARRLWKSLDGSGGISWGTLIWRAQEGGWKVPKRAKRHVLMTYWVIRDSAGAPQALKVRYWDTTDREKTDRWATPAPGFVDMNHDSSYEWGLKRRSQKSIPLYGAEKLATKPAACRTVIITEGGADADALEPIAAEHDAVVLAVMIGAPTVPNVEVFEDVVAAVKAGAIDEVLLWPDQDDNGVGQRLMGHVGKQIVNAGGPAPGIIDWQVPEQIAASTKGAGAADWAKAGAQPPLPDLIAEAKPWEPPRAGRPRKDGGQPLRGDGEDGKQEKGSTPTAARLENGRVQIEVETGRREAWMMKTVDALVKVGEEDDRHSLYENTINTGKNELWSRLAPKRSGNVESDTNITLGGKALLIERASREDIVSQVDKHVFLYRVVQKNNGESVEKPVELSTSQAGIMLSHYAIRQLENTGARFRPLVSVVEAPTISPNGTLIRKSGYDSESGLYANFRTEDWNIPECPDEADADEAVDLLYDVVSEALWQKDKEDIYKAAWLAALLTVAARSYVRGNVPGTFISGNTAGTGKGTLCDIISAICLGRLATKMPPVGGRSKDADAEERKRLTSLALRGETMIVIDNVPAGSPYGNPAFDMALTTGSDNNPGEYADRLLGLNEIADAPIRVVPFVTGNGLEVVGDLGRRGIMIRLHSTHADPAMRPYKRYPRVVVHCLAHRKELLSAALTIVLAYKNEVSAGKKVQLEEAAGSFGDWSDRIRAAVCRYTGHDPWEANRELRETAQPERRQLWTLLEAIYRNLGGDEFTLHQINDACNRSDDSSFLEPIADAVDDLSLAPPHPRSDRPVNTNALGVYLSKHKDGGGSFVVHRGTGRKWFVSLGETAPKDLLQKRDAEQATRDLLADFPKDFSVLDHVVAPDELAEILGKLDGAELLALRDAYKDGSKLAKQAREEMAGDENASYTKVWTGQVMSRNDYLADRYPEYGAVERAQAYFHEVVSRLAERTCEDHDEKLTWRISPGDLKREVNFIALRAVEEAVRELGPDADDEAVTDRAYRLAIVDTGKEPNSTRDEIVAAINHLVASRHLPQGIVDRLRERPGSSAVYLGLEPLSAPLPDEARRRRE